MKVSGQLAPFGLRMPEVLKKFLAQKAFFAGRSINAEVLHRLLSTIPLEDIDHLALSEEQNHISLAEAAELLDLVTTSHRSSGLKLDNSIENFEKLSERSKAKVISMISDLARLEALERNSK